MIIALSTVKPAGKPYPLVSSVASRASLLSRLCHFRFCLDPSLACQTAKGDSTLPEEAVYLEYVDSWLWERRGDDVVYSRRRGVGCGGVL